MVGWAATSQDLSRTSGHLKVVQASSAFVPEAKARTVTAASGATSQRCMKRSPFRGAPACGSPAAGAARDIADAHAAARAGRRPAGMEARMADENDLRR